jgi:hypothetical protein
MSDLFLPVFYATLASGVAIRVAEELINEYRRRKEEKQLAYVLDILESAEEYDDD